MLVENEKKDMITHRDYIKTFNYFHDEYTVMLREFLKRHDIKVEEDDCLIDYILKTRYFMPKYNNYTIPISNAMYNEELPEAMKYDLLMATYKDVKEAFSK